MKRSFMTIVIISILIFYRRYLKTFSSCGINQSKPSALLLSYYYEYVDVKLDDNSVIQKHLLLTFLTLV